MFLRYALPPNHCSAPVLIVSTIVLISCSENDMIPCFSGVICICTSLMDVAVTRVAPLFVQCLLKVNVRKISDSVLSCNLVFWYWCHPLVQWTTFCCIISIGFWCHPSVQILNLVDKEAQKQGKWISPLAFPMHNHAVWASAWIFFGWNAFSHYKANSGGIVDWIDTTLP